MSLARVVRLLALLAILGAAASATPGPVAAAVGGEVDAAAAAREIVARTNAFRAANRLGAVRTDPALEAAARRFAEFMAASDRYGHEADGRSAVERVAASGYEHCAVAENIAMQFSSAGFATDELAARVVEAWEQSPGHRRNLLMPHMVDIGVGLARSPATNRWYAVQLFGRPQARAARFELLNRAGVAVDYELDGRRYSLPPRVTRTHRGCFDGPVTILGPDGSAGLRFEPRDGAQVTVLRDAGGLLQLHAAPVQGQAR